MSSSHGQGSPPISTAEQMLTVPGKKRTKRVTSITSDMRIQEGQDEGAFPRVGREVGPQEEFSPATPDSHRR